MIWFKIYVAGLLLSFIFWLLLLDAALSGKREKWRIVVAALYVSMLWPYAWPCVARGVWRQRKGLTISNIHGK